MLGDYDTFTDIAVKDLAAAKDFYGGTLGLKPMHEDEWELEYQSGDSRVRVYKSDVAGTNQATYMTWNVGDDITGKVEELKGKGISFEHYDMPGASLQGDMHVMGDLKAAWFKDPDGNILCLSNM